MKTAQEIYGIRAIMEAIIQKKTIDKVCLKGKQGQLFKHLEQKYTRKEFPIAMFLLDWMFFHQNHQGPLPGSFIICILRGYDEKNNGKNAIFL